MNYLQGIKMDKCAVCKKSKTKDGHDPCIANLPGVRNACCGHGEPDRGYIQFENGLCIYFDMEYIVDWTTYVDDGVERPNGGLTAKNAKIIRFRKAKEEKQ